jgi:hypothetical protein
VDSLLLPNPFKDPDAWFDALDIRKCGRVPRSTIADALTVATQSGPEEVNSILDATMGGNRRDQYDCMDARFILAKVEKLTVGAAMESMRTFSHLGSQTQGDLDTVTDSDDDLPDPWILSISERRCARLPKHSSKCRSDVNPCQWMEVSSPMDGMAALADLGLRRRELALVN